MKYLHEEFDLQRFYSRVADSKKPVLLLDYDGTLAPFVAQRDQAYPYPGVREILTNINTDTSTRLVIISGRTVKDLHPLLDMSPSPEIWGSHGFERLLPNGHYRVQNIPQKVQDELEDIRKHIKEENLESHMELKPAGIALHWRGHRPERATELKVIFDEIASNSLSINNLTVCEFDGGVELRLKGFTKGTAIKRILADTNLDDPVAFLGDDLTDEDGFRELAGRGLSVLVRPEFRETAADLWLEPPEELLAFLTKWFDNTKGSEVQRGSF